MNPYPGRRDWCLMIWIFAIARPHKHLSPGVCTLKCEYDKLITSKEVVKNKVFPEQSGWRGLKFFVLSLVYKLCNEGQ